MKVKFYHLDDEGADNYPEFVPPRIQKKFKKKADDERAAKLQQKQKEKFSRFTLRKHHGL